jgi:hypothetical protein
MGINYTLHADEGSICTSRILQKTDPSFLRMTFVFFSFFYIVPQYLNNKNQIILLIFNICLKTKNQNVIYLKKF